MANESEVVNMVILESQFLDTETVLKKLPNIRPEEIPEIMAKKANEDYVGKSFHCSSGL